MEYLGWDIKSIYEDSLQSDLMEAEAFYMAFARLHNLDGHQILCIFTRADRKSQPLTYTPDGVTSLSSVLIVKQQDLDNMRIRETIRIDGDIYSVTRISRPVGDIIRLELESSQ